MKTIKQYQYKEFTVQRDGPLELPWDTWSVYVTNKMHEDGYVDTHARLKDAKADIMAGEYDHLIKKEKQGA